MVRWAENVAKMGETKNAYRISVRKHLGKPRRYDGNSKMNLGEG
jgi:hypothetical protein